MVRNEALLQTTRTMQSQSQQTSGTPTLRAFRDATLCKYGRPTIETDCWSHVENDQLPLLLAESSYSQFEGAAVTRKEVEETVEKVKKTDENMCFAAVYTQLSVHSFYLSNYRDAHNWSIEAVQQLTPNTCKRVTVETLSQAAKACVMKRELRLAEALIRLAVYTAAETFGTFHPKYAEALTEYGYYLLNSDSTRDSVVVYKRALKLKKAVFGEKNLHVAAMKEDLAYALYVHEYASGRFNTANHHATQAIETLTKLLPEEHLMLASAHRVKALILEEIALDHMSQFMETRLKLFSEAYSGLEYDYRGLIHVYTHLNQMDNAEGYLRIIEQWKRLRQQEVNKDRPPLEHSPPVYTLSQIQGSLEASDLKFKILSEVCQFGFFEYSQTLLTNSTRKFNLHTQPENSTAFGTLRRIATRRSAAFGAAARIWWRAASGPGTSPSAATATDPITLHTAIALCDCKCPPPPLQCRNHFSCHPLRNVLI
ncbi:unnamed protein product [Nesidiocoris tenuis]|uniref:Amyloid protein-binding protein 2 n=1 Tax=Nesidiocoris tenuis TaxID=355587 RepID=A0A6H5GQU7_9HEMI|nr:unnamed protein product [Nesidiocoris tenuis]